MGPTMTRNRLPPGRWDEVISRDGWCCQAARHGVVSDCAGRLVVHHILPRGAGGTREAAIHDASNLVTLCEHHHRFVHANPALSYESRLLRRRSA